MLDLHDLIALLEAYCRGDTLARKVLVDALEEAGDPRAAAVRAEAIAWDVLACRLATPEGSHPWLPGGPSYFRWLIDCARYGSPTRPDVAAAVRQARRDWLQGLFPEVRLAE